MASFNSISKYSYLDGVKFAINPLFLFEEDTNKSLIDHGLNLALNYDLNKAKSIIDCKYEYVTEKSSLKKSKKLNSRRKKSLSVCDLNGGGSGVAGAEEFHFEQDPAAAAVTTNVNHATDELEPKLFSEDQQERESASTKTSLHSNMNGLNKVINNQATKLKSSSGGGETKRSRNHYSLLSSSSPSSNSIINQNLIQPSVETVDKIASAFNYPSNGGGDTKLPNGTSPNFYLLNNFSNLLEPTKNSDLKNSNGNKRCETDDINNNTSQPANNSERREKTTTATTTTTSIKDIINFDLTATHSSMDPFHDMELKTINDWEELKNILQNQQQYQSENESRLVLTNQMAGMNLSSSTSATAASSAAATAAMSTSVLLVPNGLCSVDNFGLPKISFVDLDLNK